MSFSTNYFVALSLQLFGSVLKESFGHLVFGTAVMYFGFGILITTAYFDYKDINGDSK